MHSGWVYYGARTGSQCVHREYIRTAEHVDGEFTASILVQQKVGVVGHERAY